MQKLYNLLFAPQKSEPRHNPVPSWPALLKPSILSIASAVAAFQAGGFTSDAATFREWAEICYDTNEFAHAFNKVKSSTHRLGSRIEYYQEAVNYLKKAALDLRDQVKAGEGDILELFREEVKGMKGRLEVEEEDLQEWEELEGILDEMGNFLSKIEEDPIYRETVRERMKGN